MFGPADQLGAHVGVGVGVPAVGVAVAVGVTVGVAVGVRVAVGVAVGVRVAVGVAVGVGVGVPHGPLISHLPALTITCPNGPLQVSAKSPRYALIPTPVCPLCTW